MSYLNRTLPYENAFGTIDISSAKTVDEALNLSGLNWQVEPKTIYDEDNNLIENYVANTRDTDVKTLGIVTDRYRIVQNNEAFDFVNDLVSEGFKFDRAGSFRDGKSIWVMGNLPEEKILGDDVANNVVFVNSHDGSSGVKVMMTPVRLICSNMINLALKKANRIWTSKHTGHIYTKLEEAKYTLGLVNKYMLNLKEEADRLSNISITDTKIEEIFDKMFPVNLNEDSERKINNISVLKDNYIKCYNEDDIKQFKNTAYGALNAFIDLINHKEPVRVTTNYYENSWNKLINGHPYIDTFHKMLG